MKQLTLHISDKANLTNFTRVVFLLLLGFCVKTYSSSPAHFKQFEAANLPPIDLQTYKLVIEGETYATSGANYIKKEPNLTSAVSTINSVLVSFNVPISYQKVVIQSEGEAKEPYIKDKNLYIPASFNPSHLLSFILKHLLENSAIPQSDIYALVGGISYIEGEQPQSVNNFWNGQLQKNVTSGLSQQKVFSTLVKLDPTLIAAIVIHGRLTVGKDSNAPSTVSIFAKVVYSGGFNSLSLNDQLELLNDAYINMKPADINPGFQAATLRLTSIETSREAVLKQAKNLNMISIGGGIIAVCGIFLTYVLPWKKKSASTPAVIATPAVNYCVARDDDDGSL